ncbi:hypothetical protein ACOSQ2_023883 [Xanthoceras sorbifolium]
MGFDHRKLLKMEQSRSVRKEIVCVCPRIPGKKGICPFSCNHWDPPFHPPPPPPPLYPMSGDGLNPNQNHFIKASMTVIASMVVVGLIFGIFCASIRVYNLRRNNSRRRRSPPIFFGTQEDFLDENHGPALDHPFWYINTVGLPQSAIDSITVFKYKKDEGLIEGTDCSVCLCEFQEDDNLRLLPKCSHAFHIPCIDTWLRSHKNCPLCRAPVISDISAAQVGDLETNLNDSDSRNENAVVENHDGEETINVGELGGTSEVRNVHDDIEDVSAVENSKKSFPLSKTRNSNSDSRVPSDLADNQRVVEAEMQPMRRSVSLDSSSATKIYNAVANVVENGKHQRSFDNLSLKSKNSKPKMVSKPSSVSSSICKLMKSSSIGSSLQKGPISMKRSFSFSGKRSSSRHHSRRHSILPL